MNYIFNPIDKIVELYDALLKSEKGKNALLEKGIERLEKALMVYLSYSVIQS